MRRLLLAIALLALPGSGHAQEDPSARELRIGVLLGWGVGPSDIAAAGVRMGFGLNSRVALEAEYSLWAHGIPSGCDDGGIAGCQGDGALYLGGVSTAVLIASRMEGHVQVNAGLYDFSGAGVPDSPIGAGLKPSFGVDLGARIPATDGIGVHLKGRLLEVFDDAEYEAAVGDDLRYAMLMLGLEYRLPL